MTVDPTSRFTDRASAASAARLLTPATGMAHGSAELRAAGVGDEVWQSGIVLDAVGGRGGLQRVRLPEGATALVRHYRRGGAMARWFGDRYWFTTVDRTRCFAEFRLLEKLQRKGLPAPRPLAARFQRSGPWYRADLAMQELPGVQTLHGWFDGLTAVPTDLVGRRVGSTIGRFHRAGLWHADLNAYNVLLDADQSVWLVDFDRGEFRVPRRTWQQANLHRLRRSLNKLGHVHRPGFEQVFWQPLLAAHAAALEGALGP